MYDYSTFNTCIKFFFDNKIIYLYNTFTNAFTSFLFENIVSVPIASFVVVILSLRFIVV